MTQQSSPNMSSHHETVSSLQRASEVERKRPDMDASHWDDATVGCFHGDDVIVVYLRLLDGAVQAVVLLVEQQGELQRPQVGWKTTRQQDNKTTPLLPGRNTTKRRKHTTQNEFKKKKEQDYPL